MAVLAEPVDQTILSLIPGYDPVATAGDCWFDDESAALALDFFPACLQFIEGDKAGQPFVLELWQQSIVANIFGWKRQDGSRRYREAFVFVPRKNGKTPFAAGIVLLVGFCDGEPGAQMYSAAAEREQAALIYRHAAGMLVKNPELAALCTAYRTFKSIEWHDSSTTFKSLSADAETKHGLNAHLVIADEVHAYPNRDLVDVLVTSTASRRQPLMLYITTSDYERPGSICNEKYDYAIKVRDGIIEDESFLPVIYEASRDDDWTAPETWEKANPNIDVSVSRDYLERECKRAQETPTYENTFKRLHLNIRTEQDVRWVPMQHWDACGDGVTDPLAWRKEAIARHRKNATYAGLDLGSTGDLTTLVLLFDNKDGTLDIIPYFWVPEDSARDRERKDRVPYETWCRQGFIETTPGNVTDYDFLRKDINALGDWYSLKEIACDRLFQGDQLITQLNADGLIAFPFGQGFVSMAAPAKQFEAHVISHKFRHGNNPVLRWMASNAAAEIDAAGNLKPSKKKSTERIDGIVALLMSLARLMVAPEHKSVYSTRGLEVL